ncbi:cupredoxin domain-containing protein [Synechococcus sp. CCAP 1479/9]|uniref:cupredoxin domain-containing protein n=1 Tax=Synechococcus sp. CCAP 1479/9 TaxID=1221593 RepID=UPI001C24D1C3|nr:cupredoxin domain-containing protein [Synechococcus sp. CCAP 1479/9]
MTPLSVIPSLVLSAPLWRTLPQPLALRVLVAALGLALIVVELWWFLGRHGGGVVASEGEQGVQEITIAVDGGYTPSQIRVKAGRPVVLRFHRTDPSGCVAQVIFPDFQRTLDLPLGVTTSIELLPSRPGPYPFHCGMNMVRGSIEAE